MHFLFEKNSHTIRAMLANHIFRILVCRLISCPLICERKWHQDHLHTVYLNEFGSSDSNKFLCFSLRKGISIYLEAQKDAFVKS